MYKLSNYIELISELNKDKVLKHYVVLRNRSSKSFLVNHEIVVFLNNFSEPTTFENVFKQYSKTNISASENQLNKFEARLGAFYEDLLKRKWIVPEDKIEEPVNYDTLFNKGDHFLNYRIQKVLANKKRTDVYLVVDKESKKQFVIKLLNRNKFDDLKRYKRYLENFETEYNFLNKFNSIYINKAFEFKKYKTHNFMLLKYEKGKSISKYVRAHFLTTKEKIKITSKILKAFAIIHDTNVYHGDIHFSNIMINKNQQPRIIDFGYSNEVLHVQDDNKKVRNGVVYAFIPPERTIRSLDHRFSAINQYQSEVYQITLIIYYIFVKKMPFQAETWKVMVDEKNDFNIKTYLPFLSRRMPLLVRNFILKGLEKEPESRFHNAQDMFKQWQTVMRKL